MKKNKALSLLLITSIIIGTCFTFLVGANAESPNLLEMYGYDPSFSTSMTAWKTLENAKIERYQDSSDKDGWCVKLSQRDSDYSVPSLMDNDALKIFLQQGGGIYYYSFYVKCANSGQKMRIRPQFQLIYGGTYSADALENGDIVGKWIYGGNENKDGIFVDSNSWTKIEMTVTVNEIEKGKLLGEAKLYASQTDFDGIDGQGGVNAYDLLFDNFTLVKKSGSWTYINGMPTPTPINRPFPITPDPNGQIDTTVTVSPTQTPKPTKAPIKTEEPAYENDKKDEIVIWNFGMIAKDMFAWNTAADAESGIQHYFDNTTRIINWVLVVLILVSIGAIIYAVIPAKKKDEQEEIIKETTEETEETEE